MILELARNSCRHRQDSQKRELLPTMRIALGLLLSLATAAWAASLPCTMDEVCKRVPPLTHDATGRFPMIAIEAFRLSPTDRSFEDAKPLPAETIKELVKRGLTQWIPPDARYIPFAKALQEAGAAVIMMQGEAFNGPAGEDVPDGLHHLPADFKRDPDQPAQQPKYPCPLLTAGWQVRADKFRATMRKFKDAGIKVDAVWLDWEIEPYSGRSQWNEAKACTRCRKMFPAGVLDDFARYRAYITRLRTALFSTYLVAPVLESYPACSVTNWEVVLSSPDVPTPSWSGTRTFPPVGLGLFTAANPVAYGNTIWYRYHWKPERNWPLDVAHMDRVYTSVMLGEISKHEENALRLAPETQSIPWVDRFCADDRDEKIPILSRPRYKEILRHCWLRGADGMQVFNPAWFEATDPKAPIMFEELEDAVAIYDEMLAYRKFLDRGTVMNTATIEPTDDGAFWSGLRLGDEAVVRCFTQHSKPVTAVIPFPDADPVSLTAPPAGATYLLKREGKKVIATEQR
jgi:hypothetical protein